MKNNLNILKGIHPGFVLERELKKRDLNKRGFALSLGEHPQTIGAITKGKRRMNLSLSLKIEKMLKMEKGYFMTLQLHHDIKAIEEKNNKHPDLSAIRPAVFWDTSLDKISWYQQKKFVIKRIFERGNQQEKEEITNFYGKKIVEQVLKSM